MSGSINKRKRLELMLVIVPGLVFATQGCGIPALRCPKPADPLPQTYYFPNNGAAPWNSGVVDTPLDEEDSEKKTQADRSNADKSKSDKAATDKTEANKAAPDKASDNQSDAGADKAGKRGDDSAANASPAETPIRLVGFVEPNNSLQLHEPTSDNPATGLQPVPNATDDATPFAHFIRAASAQGLNGPEQTSAASKAGTEPDAAPDADAATSGSQAKSDDDATNDSAGSGNNPTDVVTDELEFAPISMDYGTYSMDNSASLPWSQFFNDTYLSSLISQALLGNQELKILAEDIQIANNEVLKWRGSYLPFVTLGGEVGVEKPSLFTPLGAAEKYLDFRPGQGFPDPLPKFMVATNVSWEIDIWRRLRNSRDAACLRYLGTRDGWNYVVTRMVAEVAENYYQLLALDNQLATLDRTIQLQEQSLDTAERMKAGGRGTELAVQRFKAEVRKNQSHKLIIQQQIVEAENRINFLLGRYPQHVDRANVEFIDLNLNSLSAGVPAQLLRNRSDIRQAERELAAAGLDVKVARANFYPQLNVSAGIGYAAFNPKYLFSTPDALMYNLVGDLVGPLINKRAIRADYMTANARQLQALYEYQRTILNAFTEVTNHINKVENYRTGIEIKKLQLESLVASVDSASKLFQNARAEYVDVLLAQRDFNEAKMDLIDTKQEQLAAIVNAYQALGGGGMLQNANFATPFITTDVAVPDEPAPINEEIVEMEAEFAAPVIVAPVTN